MTATYKTYKSYKPSKSGVPSMFDKKKNYSSFWMDDDSYGSRFAGLGNRGGSGSDDVVKAIKLNTYQRAIANFVQILTKKAIPVVFEGSTSFTDGESVTISTDIKDSNFDVSVGLALHEASHILLTDFAWLREKSKEKAFASNWSLWKDILNWIEDRRIDNYVFKTSPGYRAYYHKMYDYYWNDPAVTKGLKSNEFRDSTNVEHYMFHIINSLNPAADRTALPGLDTILDLINVTDIARLKNSPEAGEVASLVMAEILKHATATPEPKEKEEEGEGDSTPLTQAEKDALEKAMEKQRNFLSGQTGKKTATKRLMKRLETASNSTVDVQAVGTGPLANTVVVYDLKGPLKCAEVTDLVIKSTQLYNEITEASRTGQHQVASKLRIERDRILKEKSAISRTLPEGFQNGSIRSDYEKAIQRGLEMGGLLGKKLQIRNESRDLVYNRLRSGHIDNRRLAQAGFGMETVFKQTLTDNYKEANLHISLDGSSSMCGERWEKTVQMAVAIAKAATYVQNLRIQISIRCSMWSSAGAATPVLIHCYDSKQNKLNHFVTQMLSFNPTGGTPEGLCYEAMILRKEFVQGTSQKDSYFLNISDGEPSGSKNYEGQRAYDHTKAQINKLAGEYNMGIMSFFVNERPDGYSAQQAFRAFKLMYSEKYSHLVDPNQVLEIAKTMNKTFLQKAGV